MATFFEELWESIFTPGPTPSLLIATNATFAVLQVVLFVLLVATYSVHFIVLSLLSGGLWWAVNWFANELEVARRRQEEQDEDERRKQRRRAVVAAATASAVSTSDSETEVEATTAATAATAAKGQATGQSSARGEVRQRTAAAAVPPAASPPAGTLQAAAQAGQSSQGVSTEDEWEKVSENEKET